MALTDSDLIFKNPLEEDAQTLKIAEPCVLVIFGVTGDLTSRKLLPALYNLSRDGQLPAHFACVGFARRQKTHEVFREEMHEAVSQFSRVKPIDETIWKSFSQQLFYHLSEFDSDEGYDSLKKFLNELDAQFDTKGNRVFYLSTPPSYFPIITQKLKEHDLIYPADQSQHPWSRVIIEKPFGHDLASAKALQAHISTHMDESQVCRIDHYLGKETVQNLLVFRLANPIFESLWNRQNIDHVQITVAEEIGIGTRGRFFEEAGMLRDIVQNHMMQLLSLVAMELPFSLQAKAIRDEKVKVLEAIRPIPHNDFNKYVVRGQYGKGLIEGKPVCGYREENNVDPQSNVETYVALKLFIDNWRWAGIPFYLRAGKRLAKRATEIAIVFKDVPRSLVESSDQKSKSNILVIRIQPDEGISLKMNYKVPSLNGPVQPVKMDFRYSSYFGMTPPEAYERLICDCMSGDYTLFARDDEVLKSWELLTPVLDYWKEHPSTDFPNYESGTWGPKEAERMLKEDGRHWRLI